MCTVHSQSVTSSPPSSCCQHRACPPAQPQWLLPDSPPLIQPPTAAGQGAWGSAAPHSLRFLALLVFLHFADLVAVTHAVKRHFVLMDTGFPAWESARFSIALLSHELQALLIQFDTSPLLDPHTANVFSPHGVALTRSHYPVRNGNVNPRQVYLFTFLFHETCAPVKKCLLHSHEDALFLFKALLFLPFTFITAAHGDQNTRCPCVIGKCHLCAGLLRGARGSVRPRARGASRSSFLPGPVLGGLPVPALFFLRITWAFSLRAFEFPAF